MTNKNWQEIYPGNEIDPTAQIYPGVQIGTGNIIGPYCIIGYPPEWKGHEDSVGKVVIGNNNRFTGLVTIDSGVVVNTTIGNGCYFMKHSHVGHDAQISDGVTVSCGAKIGGHCEVGDDVTIGLNAVIHQRKKIPEGCMIGMGAVITKGMHMTIYRKYAGNPARDIGSNHIAYEQYLINQKQYQGEGQSDIS